MAAEPQERRDAAVSGPRVQAALMSLNGITRIRADQYHVDGYRYANLADALAQVRRFSAAPEAAS